MNDGRWLTSNGDDDVAFAPKSPCVEVALHRGSTLSASHTHANQSNDSPENGATAVVVVAAVATCVEEAREETAHWIAPGSQVGAAPEFGVGEALSLQIRR